MEDRSDYEDNSGYHNTTASKKRKHLHSASKPSRSTLIQPSSTRTEANKAEAFILNDDSDDDDKFRTRQSSHVPGTFGRSKHGKNQNSITHHKHLSHELDTDDELMMQMRENNFSDRQIADKLAQDGRVRYDPKSISTRIMRIRLAQAENVDTLIRDGYKEWEFEDDCILLQSYALADIEVSYEMERIRALRFRKVSEYMRRLDKNRFFSASACRERYCALINGTARIPSTLDDDPAARRAELHALRTASERLRARQKEQEAAKRKQEEKDKEETRLRSAQRAEEKARLKAKREAGKAERALKRAEEAKLRAERSLENQKVKERRNALVKMQKEERERGRERGKVGKVRKGKGAAKSKGRVDVEDEHEDGMDGDVDVKETG